MISIGNLQIKNIDSLNESRKKIMSLAESLKFNEIQAARLASIISEICHSEYLNNSDINIETGFTLQDSQDSLYVKLKGFENFDRIRDINLFFDKISFEKNDVGMTQILAIKKLPDNHPILSNEYINQQTELFAIPSKAELMNILKEKNKELEIEAQKLLIAKESAEIATAAKSEFLANMSHEIRTPMNAILGFAEILSGRTKEDEQKNYLNIILSSGNALLTIINDILDLSKIEAGKLELQPSFMDLGRIISEIQQMFTKKVEDKGIEFLIDIGTDLPTGIFLDEVRIRQIILNLTGNAIKFTEKGYVKVTAHHMLNPNGCQNAEITITVQDTGIGIPAGQIDKIFKPFEQVKGQSTKKFGGTGLGLSISTKLVKMMHGRISATSEHGKGSIFTIKFPEVPIEIKLESNEGSEVISELDVKFEPANILVVDDVVTNRMVVQVFLQDYDLKITEAENGEEALEKIKSEKFDLIFTDLKMSGISGEELTKILKSREDTKHIPIIMLSASAMKEEEERCMKIVDRFLIKPVDRVKLIKEIKGFLPFCEKPKESSNKTDKTEKIIKKSELVELSPEKFSEFCLVLNKFSKEWVALNKSRQITAVKEFADRLDLIAKEYLSEQLAAYALELKYVATSLKVTKIKNLLNDFPKLVEILSQNNKK